MVFILNNLKYDTDKMELISEKCNHSWSSEFFSMKMCYQAKDVKLYRSKKGNWLLTYRKEGYSIIYAEVLTEDEAKAKLIRKDLEKYEEIFGELEEA